MLSCLDQTGMLQYWPIWGEVRITLGITPWYPVFTPSTSDLTLGPLASRTARTAISKTNLKGTTVNFGYTQMPQDKKLNKPILKIQSKPEDFNRISSNAGYKLKLSACPGQNPSFSLLKKTTTGKFKSD